MFATGTALFRRRASSELHRICLWNTSIVTSRPPSLSTAAAAECKGPPPIRVSLTESAGRCVFATRGIAAGDLIHSAKPLVTHPSASLLDEVCYYCLRRLQKEASSVDASALGENESSSTSTCYFCSESCREQSKVFHEVEKGLDWSAFDAHCSTRRLKYPLMVKRLACMIISGAASVDCLDLLQPASLHPDIVMEMEEEFQLLKDIFVKGQFNNEMLTFFTKEWYVNVLARIRINAFRIELVARSYEEMITSATALVAADAAVGNAIYMLPSFYNHDCDPNAHIIWLENANAKLKALRDIEEGEELRICYIDASMDFEARQKILAEGFGFQCRCLRCLYRD
ncbi:histone-lysine N-methyltransferase ATXR4 [Canna indica]|uniref:Histone-lysine N-methyltransferase ATXR4 n=1 Tax=Canna indica TaxID=4628 RepID=A0AAQ3JMR4_9LILI|nr:histone-lysine N-methyltransferase ATXR4 [Canna indica]